MSEVSKTWVIVKTEFNPFGFFYTETHVRKGRSYRWVRGLTNAKRMTKAEAIFIRDELMGNELVRMGLKEKIIIFNLADAMFGEGGR
jgi:hypothetical protein